MEKRNDIEFKVVLLGESKLIRYITLLLRYCW